MRPRYPLACIDRRTTPALQARCQLLLVSFGLTAIGLLLILALVLVTRP